MDTHTITHETETRRIRWVYDREYSPFGSFAYDTEAETEAAERWEAERLGDGRLVALGAIVETKCPTCGRWQDVDSLWGIVIEPDDGALVEFANHCLIIPT